MNATVHLVIFRQENKKLFVTYKLINTHIHTANLKAFCLTTLYTGADVFS